MNIGRVVDELGKRTDRQTDILIATLRTPGNEVKKRQKVARTVVRYCVVFSVEQRRG